MKNKLHTVCHPEPSLRVAKPFGKLKTGFEKSKSHSIFYVLFSILLTIFSIPVTAQPYEWDWAVSGGGSIGSGGWDYQVEQIFDIAIDSNNNYYFVAKITNGTPQLNGQSVTVYGNPQGGNDIFIFSTTCDGQVRWSQAIGWGRVV